MPPIRTVPLGLNAKPIKTERTHEENQERAYIAASRRSDRSLEARIESARRASEIHKKRTGRALRVTEQDVINEEMYEEEDDDLPLQYRRIMQAIPVTPDQPFNRKLQAWFLAQHATRAALLQNEQNVNNLWAQQYPNAPHFAHYTSPQTSRPMAAPSVTATQAHQATPRSPSLFRYQPYPTTPQDTKPATHQRAASVANPQELGFAEQNAASLTAATDGEARKPADNRRMSMPASTTPQPQLQSGNAMRPSASRTNSSQTLASGYGPSATQRFQASGAMHHPYSNLSLQLPPNNFSMHSFSPFSPTLPLDAQQMFSYDSAELFSPNFSLANSGLSMYDFTGDPATSASASSSKQAQTLAPSALDTSVPSNMTFWNTTDPTSATTAPVHSADAGDEQFSAFSQTFLDLPKGHILEGSEDELKLDTQPSGTVTPNGDAAWMGLLENWTDGDSV